MACISLDESKCKAAVVGGAFLGGGGGGSKDEGLKMARLSLNCGDPKIVDIEDLKDGKIVTVSAVGAPAAKEQYIKPSHYVKAVEILMNKFNVKVSGMISSETGGLATINGWFQSSIMNIPVLDAPCDGRAHPTGAMGSMGLNKMKAYESIQVAVGGDPSKNKYVECSFKGSLDNVSNMVRQVASIAGGLVAVARNPVSINFLKKNAALRSIRRSIEIGEKILDSGTKFVKEMVDNQGGEIIIEGEVKEKKLKTIKGFDIGKIKLPHQYNLTFWNEFMTLEKGDRRIATFPDLIFTVKSTNGLPLTSAEIKEGEDVLVGYIPKKGISLGAGLKEKDNLKVIEDVIDKMILDYN